MTNFDERAKDWDSDPKKVERARAVAETIRKAIPLFNQHERPRIRMRHRSA